MKEYIILYMLLTFSTNLFAQHINSKRPITGEDYLKKSNNQKSAGWFILGGGVAVLGVTAISAASSVCLGTSCPKRSSSVVPLAIGGSMMLSSVPLFIAAAKNKNKANLLLKADKVFISPALHIKEQLSIGMQIRL